MSTSMVATVLEIEREAEAVLTTARHDAEKIAAEAKTQRELTTKTTEEAIRQEIADLETKAAADREKKVRELNASGDAALSAVRNISDAAFDAGVQYVLKALTGK